jgi:hypothetical protein
MSDELKDGNTRGNATAVARVGAVASLVLLAIGWLALREHFYGSRMDGDRTMIFAMVIAWALGIFAGVLALNLVYTNRIAKDARVVIVDVAIVGAGLNSLSIAFFVVLYCGLSNIR